MTNRQMTQMKMIIFNILCGLHCYMSVVSVSMPAELLNRIDQFADDHGYTGQIGRASCRERVCLYV